VKQCYACLRAILKDGELTVTKQGKRCDKLEEGQKDLQRQIGDLKYNTPSRIE
jgi:hypothetical protein